MEFTSIIKSYIFKICFILLLCGILLWISAFFYGLLYYVYIPAVAHVKPIYFKYDIPCFKKEICRFPYDNITLVEKGHYELLRAGQAYNIEIILEMPESERNLDQGMFMVHLDMLSQNGEVIQKSSRPVILHYKSTLFKYIYTLFFIPGLLAGSIEEKQTLVISLFEKFIEDPYLSTYFAYVEIQAKFAEIYSSSLRIHAQFTGLRYFMYYWPILSAIIGIGSNFLFLAMIVVFLCLRQIMNDRIKIDDDILNEQENGLQDIRESLSQTPTSFEEKITSEAPDYDKEIENLSSFRESSSQPENADDELSSSIRRRIGSVTS